MALFSHISFDGTQPAWIRPYLSAVGAAERCQRRFIKAHDSRESDYLYLIEMANEMFPLPDQESFKAAYPGSVPLLDDIRWSPLPTLSS